MASAFTYVLHSLKARLEVSSFSDPTAIFAPGLPLAMGRDLIYLHKLYIGGTTPVSTDLGSGLIKRRVFIIPHQGTVLVLNQACGEGVDKFVEKILYIDRLGKASLRVLSSPKRGKGEHYAKIAAISEHFHSPHVLRFQHFYHGNNHYLLSDLKSSDAYSYFCNWKKPYNPSTALLDVFIGAFKGLIAVHSQGYIHGDLQNPRNTLVERCSSGRLTGVLTDLDQTRNTALPDGNVPRESELVPSIPNMQKKDVKALLCSFLQILGEMRKKKGFDSISLNEQLEKLIGANFTAIESLDALQSIRMNLSK